MKLTRNGPRLARPCGPVIQAGDRSGASDGIDRDDFLRTVEIGFAESCRLHQGAGCPQGREAYARDGPEEWVRISQDPDIIDQNDIGPGSFDEIAFVVEKQALVAAHPNSPLTGRPPAWHVGQLGPAEWAWARVGQRGDACCPVERLFDPGPD